MAKKAARRRFALKSKEWFYKQCLLEIQNRGPLSRPSWEILLKGIAQEDSTRGHVTHPIGAIQGFFNAYPHHRATVQAAPVGDPFDILSDPVMTQDWNDFLANELRRTAANDGAYGKAAFGYNYETLTTYLPPALGGPHRRKPGGVGLDEFKRVLRLMADFFDRH